VAFMASKRLRLDQAPIKAMPLHPPIQIAAYRSMWNYFGETPPEALLRRRLIRWAARHSKKSSIQGREKPKSIDSAGRRLWEINGAVPGTEVTLYRLLREEENGPDGGDRGTMGGAVWPRLPARHREF